MRRMRARSTRVAGLLAVALGAVALLAVPAIAAACNGGDPGNYGQGWSHHHHHHQFPPSETGKISAFSAETGKLTITLTDGETVTGFVTEETRIDCGTFGDFRFDHHYQGNQGGDWGNWGPGGGDGTQPEGEAPSCGTESLVTGAVVDGAQLHLEEGKAVFDEIDLAPTGPTSSTPSSPSAPTY